MMMEGINQLKVCEWLQEALPEIKTPVSFSLLAGGYSNLTFKILDAAGASYVLRRPPLGRVLECAHDMGREYKIISALQRRSRCPELWLCVRMLPSMVHHFM